MRLINKLNSSPSQRAVLTGNMGQRIIMDLRYLPTQKTWMANIQFDEFTLNGITVTTSPNILRAYNNIVSFGMACITDDGQDPRNLSDFDSGYAALYLLSSDEVQLAEEVYFS